MLRHKRCDMEDRTPALLVYGHEGSLDAMKDLLNRQGVETSRVLDCTQAARVLRSKTPPVLVFTATNLQDGSWEDVVESASAACRPVPVIVVSKQEDVPLSLRVWEFGGTDCVAPPFSDHEVARVVCRAMINGFLATCSWPPADPFTESSGSNAENYVGSGVLAA
jgi:DNA-binding NtrC family response regulator